MADPNVLRIFLLGQSFISRLRRYEDLRNLRLHQDYYSVSVRAPWGVTYFNPCTFPILLNIWRFDRHVFHANRWKRCSEFLWRCDCPWHIIFSYIFTSRPRNTNSDCGAVVTSPTVGILLRFQRPNYRHQYSAKRTVINHGWCALLATSRFLEWYDISRPWWGPPSKLCTFASCCDHLSYVPLLA